MCWRSIMNNSTTRLTKRGKAVVAVAYAAVTIVAGIVLGECLLKGLEAEGRMRDAQSAPYIQAVQNKAHKGL